MKLRGPLCLLLAVPAWVYAWPHVKPTNRVTWDLDYGLWPPHMVKVAEWAAVILTTVGAVFLVIDLGNWALRKTR
jgi:hypothetical protein